MVDSTALEEVKKSIDRGQRFVLTTHVNPDGDGIGSEAALAAFLLQLGKDVFIYNSSTIPNNYRFLDPDGLMTVYDQKIHREILYSADCIFILDISEWNRLRRVGEDIRPLKTRKICIDHHPQNGKFVNVNLVDVTACATGEIVFDLLKFCNATISKHIAEAIYASIITDTGSFRYSNTTVRAYSISAELVENGVNPSSVFKQVYENQPKSKVRLFAYVLDNLHFEKDDQLVWVEVPKHIFEQVGARTNETDGFADYPRRIAKVEVSVMFIDLPKGGFKVSLRSGGKYVVNGVAQKFGGGGHPFAAGISIDGPLPEYRPKILDEICALIGNGK
jgi:phosphoesterase RecJ-like protein